MNIRRKHQSITFHLEKKVLDYLAKKIFRLVIADQLSLFALSGAILSGISYILAGKNILYLHLANLGLIIHWLGDSLDGRIARLREENRPKYGHYLDHLLDAVSVVIIVFGINYSSLTLQSEWVWVLAIFLLLMIHSFLKTSVTGVFELSIERFGGTEARLGLILINLVLIATNNPHIADNPNLMNLIDVIGFAVSILLLLNFLKTVSKTLWGKEKITEDS